MKADVKARWLAALRGGDYQQGKGALHHDGRFCCLGVLCDLAAADEVVVAGEPDSVGNTRYVVPGVNQAFRGDVALLPEAVSEWAGLDGSDPSVLAPRDVRYGDAASDDGLVVGGDEAGLATLNDAGLTFAEIADLIEQQL